MLPNVDQKYSNWVEHAKVFLLLFADTLKIYLRIGMFATFNLPKKIFF